MFCNIKICYEIPKLVLVFGISLLTINFWSCNNTKNTEKTKNQTVMTKVRIPSDFYLILERTPCYGTCPTFKLEVDPKGVVKYEGKRFVPNLGSFTKTLPEEVLQKIYERLKGAELFKYQDNYDQPGVSDLPTCKLHYRAGGKLKEISMRANTPKELDALTVELEKMIGEDNYIKVENKE